MIVEVQKTFYAFVNPKILEEYYEDVEVDKLTTEEMEEIFSEISENELIDLCEDYGYSTKVEVLIK